MSDLNIDNLLQSLDPKSGRKTSEIYLIIGLIAMTFVGQIGPMVSAGDVPATIPEVFKQIASQIIQAGLAIYYVRKRHDLKQESTQAKMSVLTDALKGANHA